MRKVMVQARGVGQWLAAELEKGTGEEDGEGDGGEKGLSTWLGPAADVNRQLAFASTGSRLAQPPSGRRGCAHPTARQLSPPPSLPAPFLDRLPAARPLLAAIATLAILSLSRVCMCVRVRVYLARSPSDVATKRLTLCKDFPSSIRFASSRSVDSPFLCANFLSVVSLLFFATSCMFCSWHVELRSLRVARTRYLSVVDQESR